MPNSRQTSVMASPSRSRATKRRRSSITELAFHGIYTSRRTKTESVTHVSGTFCHLCLGPLIKDLAIMLIIAKLMCPQGVRNASAGSRIVRRFDRSRLISYLVLNHLARTGIYREMVSAAVFNACRYAA